MREIDELYADSGEPVKESRGVSRGTALKVGGLGLAGALAAFMPGRAGAAVKRHASNASCAGTGFFCFSTPKICGYDIEGPCACLGIHYGRIRPTRGPVGACSENAFCGDLSSCTSNRDCPTGTFCSSSCCDQDDGYPFLCSPFCGQGALGQASPALKTPKTLFHK